MSNRNFDNRVIIQRLQDQVNANNLYNYNKNGKKIISNPQNSVASFSRILSYEMGTETTYQQTLSGSYTSSIGGVANLIMTPIIPPPSPIEPPSGLPTASLWFDPSDTDSITVTSGIITSFVDKTGNGNNGVSLNNNTFYNIAPINGLGTVRFNNSAAITPIASTSQMLKVTNYDFNDTFISYAIIVNYRSGGSGFVATDTPGLFGRGIGCIGGKAITISYNAFTTWDGTPSPDITIPTNDPTIIVASISAGNWIMSINGTQYTLSLTQAKIPDNTEGLNIGCWNPTNASNIVFDCGELLVYTSFLSTTEIQRVEGYLATKWGLLGNLPSNHPYKNGYP